MPPRGEQAAAIRRTETPRPTVRRPFCPFPITRRERERVRPLERAHHNSHDDRHGEKDKDQSEACRPDPMLIRPREFVRDAADGAIGADDGEQAVPIPNLGRTAITDLCSLSYRNGLIAARNIYGLPLRAPRAGNPEDTARAVDRSAPL